MGTLLFAPPRRPGPEPRLFYALDLGRRRSFAALTVIERNSISTGFDHATWQTTFAPTLVLRHAERLPLGTSYTNLLTQLRRFFDATRTALPGNFHLLPGHTPQPQRTLAVDASGLGAPIVEFISKLMPGLALLPITITSGANPSPDPLGGLRVPRSALIANLRLLLETGLLRLPSSLHNFEALRDELSALSLESSRSTDDLALSLALAAWAAHPGAQI